MRKKELNNLLKLLKKKNQVNGIRFNPTLEECEYLHSKGVDITKDTILRTGLATGCRYPIDVTSYSLN